LKAIVGRARCWNQLTTAEINVYIQAMSAKNIKEEAKRLLEKLPEDLTWDQLMHEIYVRQSIEAGSADSKAGKAVGVQKVRERFGLPS
jgi:hypothetical protein